ncbi:UMP kinase [Spiroplasma endosymbiont of Othius punctulatus]|uniref:UMP kinase n=1 Tax=Spiroplasma endosymbiont of Othius punctulatus TaxID=3066289 RepID=UPI0030CD3DE1
MKKFKRVLLKLSGESLKSETEMYEKESIYHYADQVIELAKQGIEIGVVIGAGNIWRGKLAGTLELNKIDADFMGMFGTIMNTIAFAGVLRKQGYEKVKVYSALEIKTLTSPYNYIQAREELKNGYIVLFAGGTGYSHFTTDTAAAIRAIEIGADAILMGKNGVKGVYDSDPKLNPNAKFFKTLTHAEVIDKKLQVMDSTAASTCRDANMRIVVFDINVKNNIVNVINNKTEMTIIE